MPGNELGDRVHNFFVQENSSQEQHHAQIVEGNWPVLNNNFWVGNQRTTDLVNPESKNCGLRISERDIKEGSYNVNASHGLDFAQATVMPGFAQSQYQNKQPNVNGSIYGSQVHQTRHNNVTKSMAVDAGPNQHRLMTTRGLSIHEFQKGSGLEHQAKISLSSEAISPLSLDLFGGQHQMSFQQSSMLQPLQHQQSGLDDVQQVQQQALFKRMQELQRQQQLDLRQQDLYNQKYSSFAKQACSSQSSLNNGTPNSDASHHAWMVDHGNSNWLNRASSTMQGSSSGLAFTPNHGQTQRLVDMAPGQAEQSLYGVPVSSSRGLVNQYSQMGMDRPMLQMLANNSSLPGQYTLLHDQVSLQDGTLISGHRFQNENMWGCNSSQALNTAINMESVQQVNSMQRNTHQQDNWGRQELSLPRETTEKKQVVSSRNEDALDPMEEKILFGSDDNIQAPFGKNNNMSGKTVNLFDDSGLPNGVPSIQSGSWSALMQSAAAETSSSDLGFPDKWSGLIHNNAEVPSANQRQPTYDNRGKQAASLAEEKMQLTSKMSSAIPPSDSNTNNHYQNFMGFNQFGTKFQGEPAQRLHSEASQRLVSLQEYGKWLDSSSVQRVSERSQMRGNASQPSLDVEKNSKSISTPSFHDHSGAGGKSNAWNASAAVSYGGDQMVNAYYESGKLSQNSQSNPVRTMHGVVDHRRSSWKSIPPRSIVESGSRESFVGSPQASKVGLSLNDPASVNNSITTRVDVETSQFVQGNLLFHQWKNANSLVKSQGGNDLGKMGHQINNNNMVLHSLNSNETKNYDLKENSNGSHQSNISQRTSAGLRGSGLSDGSDSHPLVTRNQKSLNQPPPKVSGPYKFQYHPMGNLDEDVETPYSLKRPTQLQQLSLLNNQFGQSKFQFGQSKFPGHVPKNSVVMEKGQSSDLQTDGKSPDEGPSLQNQLGYASNIAVPFSRSIDAYTSNKASPSSQNMLDLLHKVDQSRDNGTEMHSDSSKTNIPFQLPESRNRDGSVGRLQNNQSSVSQGFALQLGPPSQCMQIPDNMMSSQNAQQNFNSLYSAGQIGEEDRQMAPTLSVQSLPNEQSQVEIENNNSGTEAFQYKIQANFSSALNSTFTYSKSHLQNPEVNKTRGQISPNVGLSLDKSTLYSTQRELADAFSPNVSGSIPHGNAATLESTLQRTESSNIQVSEPATTISSKGFVAASQPVSRLDSSQQEAPAQLLRNMWANVPMQRNPMGAPYYKASSHFSQHPLPNIVESSSSIHPSHRDHDVRKEGNSPSESGAMPTNSQVTSREEERLKESCGQQLGKAASIKNPSDHSPTDFASTPMDIEAFGQSLKPNSFPHQNISLNQRWATKDTETDPDIRASKRMKGPDDSMCVEPLALKTVQSNEHSALVIDSLGSSTAFSSGDAVTLRISEAADLLENNIPSQHGNISTKLGFGQDVTQSGNLSDTTAPVKAENPRISPQMAPSWFSHYGTFKNDQMPDKVNSFRTAEPPSLWKSSSNNQALGLVEHGIVATVDIRRAVSVQNSSPTSIETGPKKRKNGASELHPWHKEISQGSQNLQTHSLAEVEWAKAVNCKTEKVEDVFEFIEDRPQMHGSKRRLILTTRLMQRLFCPPSAAVLSANASLNIESMAFFIARMALGDACSAISCSSNSNMACNGKDLLPSQGTLSTRNGDKHFAEFTGELMGRMRKLENEFLRLDNSPSVLDLKLESQDLEKFSIINRFALFHSRGQTDNTATAPNGDGMASSQKTCPQRYVTALPMPRSVPEKAQCLSL